MDNVTVEIWDGEECYLVSLTNEECSRGRTDAAYFSQILNNIKNGTIPIISPRSTTAQQRVTGAIGENTTNVVNGTNVEEPYDSWTTQGTLAFLTEYEKFHDSIDRGKIKQKDAFTKISSNLQKLNILMTPKQCSTKLTSLKRSYKKVKDINNKSGNSRKNWQYLERMENIFAKKPWMQPVTVYPPKPNPNFDDSGQESTDEASAPEPKRIRLSTTTDEKFNEVMALFKKRDKERAALRERHHNEKMQLLKELVKNMNDINNSVNNFISLQFK